MRRTGVLMVTMLAVMLLAGGMALAVNRAGSNGPDALLGTDGGDTLVGRGGPDAILGRGGNDILGGGGGGDVIHGGPGRDRGQNAGSGRGRSNGSGGGPGDDIVYLGPGNDGTFPGGEGPEAFRACPTGAVSFGAICDFEGGPGNDTMFGGEGDDAMDGDSLITDFPFTLSDPRGGSDTIYGGDGDDTIYGNAGADKIYGDDGEDLLDGEEGANTLFGGSGDDSLETGNRGASEVWHGGSGNDDFFRDYQEGGPADLYRVAASDTFYGGDGSDRFFALAEARGDVFYGSDGNDSFRLGPVVGSGKHRVSCGSGSDTVDYEGPERRDLVVRDCERVRWSVAGKAGENTAVTDQRQGPGSTPFGRSGS